MNEKEMRETLSFRPYGPPSITVPLPVLMLVLMVVMIGCATLRPPAPVIASQNVQRLQERPDAPEAVKAAPEWVRDALKTINALEGELREEKIRSEAR